jgi:hypothetical protein
MIFKHIADLSMCRFRESVCAALKIQRIDINNNHSYNMQQVHSMIIYRKQSEITDLLLKKQRQVPGHQRGGHKQNKAG